jgi:tripeptide aminopeptidase
MSNLLERVTSEFVGIVQIDSLSLKEEKMFAYLQKRLENLPVSMEFLPYTIQDIGMSSGNLIVRVPATAPNRRTVFFDSHVDTVEPGIGIKPVIVGNKVRSDGKTVLGSDDKAGVAAMIIAVEELCKSKVPHGEVLFIFTSAEEIGLTGVHHLDFTKIRADYGFILDSHGKVGGVIVAAPHHFGYTITVKGKASHAGIAPEKGISAIKIAAKIVSSLPQGKLGKNSVANIGMIDGGVATNIIPEECVIKGEFRCHIYSDAMVMKKQITETVSRHRDGAKKVELKFNEMYKGFSYDPKDPILRLVHKAIQSIGLKPRYERTGGGSNTNLYNQNKIASLTLAVGMTNVHSTDEYIETDDLENLTKLILKIVEIA